MKKENTSIKKVPNLRFPNFHKEWETRKLGGIATFYSGGTPSTAKREYFNGSIPFIRSGEINSQQTEQFISELGLKNSSAKMVEIGDILYALYGATSGEVGISKIKGAINQAVLCIKSTENHYFLYSYLSHKKETITKTYLQGGQGNLSAEIVKQIEVSIPSIEEQEKISTFLSLIDERIHTQIKIIEGLTVLKTALAKKIFSQQLRFKDENGNYYPDWEIKKLGHISTITTGSSNREDSMLEGEYTFFDRSQDIRKSNRYLFDKEAVIIPGEGQEFTPKYFIGKFDLHQRTYAIFDFKEINGKYLYYHLLDNDRHLQSQAVGSTVKSLRLPMFQSMPIKSPCIEEQQKIAKFLSSIDNKIEIETNVLQKLEEQKKFLLQNMFV